MISRSTSLIFRGRSISYSFPKTERKAFFKTLIFSVLFSFGYSLGLSGQCNVMVTDPNVVLNVGTGSFGTLDAAAVAGHITPPGAGCINYDFKDVNATSLG
ncbi:MAG: hypothetical protein HKN16_11795, partial [Saprospiraceae bacterium]|nr:hypothetical protein [Saprospiraceae bacterium]